MLTLRTCMSALSTAALAAAGVFASVPAPAQAEPPGWRYTMAAFSNTTDGYFDIYESSDGTHFHPVRLPAYKPPFGGLVRDPSIFRHSDGGYYVAYTTNGSGNTIGLAHSPDRLNWAFRSSFAVPLCCAGQVGTGTGAGSSGSTDGSSRIPVNPGPGSSGSAGSAGGPSLSPVVTKAWAPEWFVDNGIVHIILSLSTGGGFVPHIITALEPSLTVWGPPIPMTGLTADHIDTTIVKEGGMYHAFTKNETKKVIEHAVAPNPFGPYTFVAPGNWGAWREGPSLTQLPNGTWRMYLDAYTDRRYFYSDSTDGLRTWSRPKEMPGVSGKVRHFTIMREAR